MSSQPLMRTEYWNPSTNTVRGGATAHGESLTDAENYFLPQAQMTGASLFTWGVADGLSVSATPNQPALTIAPGVALDAAGHLIALAANGFAIVDPSVDPNQIQNIPTVPVAAIGVSLTTAALNGDCFLTLQWREVLGQSQLANAPVLIHAPWLRLLGVAGFQDDGQQVILAKVSLDPSGLVTALSADGRRLAGLPAGRLELRHPLAAALPALAIDQLAGSELRARPDGGLEVNLLPTGGGAPRQPLAIDGATGNLWLAPQAGRVGIGTTNPSVALEIDRGAANDPALKLTSSGTGWGSGLLFSNNANGGKTYGAYSGSDGKWHLADHDNALDRLVLDPSGNLGLGTETPARALHVEGASEIHSGGPGGGLSFGNRETAQFVLNPTAGERWVWYASGGSARLWSGGDRLTISATGEGGGLDVARRMRVRQAADSSAGIWFFQSAPQADRAFVGMADDTHVGFWGNTGAGWGLRMDTSNRNLLFGGDYGRPDGPSTLSLWGSRIGDIGNGVLYIRSGGGVIAFDGAANVGIGTAKPNGKLDVYSTGTAVSGHGGAGFLVSGVYGEGGIGVYANGQTTGVFASGKNTGVLGISSTWAGQFFGNVNITGTLSKGGGGFKIDHPLNPANQYLSHSFVESPEMLNIYRGNVTTDGQGEAIVEMPTYFDALNRDFSYHLTVIGEMAQAIVASTVKDGRFTIRTERPNLMVSWLVLGVRQDPWANANRIPVEEEKPEAERTFFLHPEVYRQPTERGLLQARYGDQIVAEIGKG